MNRRVDEDDPRWRVSESGSVAGACDMKGMERIVTFEPAQGQYLGSDERR